MKKTLVFMLSFLLLGCPKNDKVVVTNTTSEKPIPEPEKTMELFSGRCHGIDTLEKSILFFPNNGEMFLTLNEYTVRSPIQIKSTKEKINFIYQWKILEDVVTTSEDASISRYNDESVYFEFNNMDDFLGVCVDDQIFHENLIQLGVKPGKYIDVKNNSSMTFYNLDQRIYVKDKKEYTIYYRVDTKIENNIKLFISLTEPESKTSSVWLKWDLLLDGNKISVDTKKGIRNYVIRQ